MTTAQWAGSTSQLYGYRSRDKRGSEAVPAWRAEVLRQQGQGHMSGRGDRGGGGTLTRKSVERLDLETRSAQGGGSRGHKARAHSVDPHATIRSHNLRSGGGSSSRSSKANLLELFHFSDSYRDMREQNRDGPPTATSSSSSSGPAAVSSPGMQHSPRSFSSRGADTPTTPITSARADHFYGGIISPSQMPQSGKGTQGSYYIRPQPYVPYADSEPAYRKSYSRAVSVSGHSDSAYPKQGDDSAISMGSRGENPYGFNNDSEYSYNEYTDTGSGSTVIGREDNWSPPDDISGLSVQEVSRSLRYIGMKDRVVLRFANEQIDGSMLCSLDKRLLKEGFPELNALEIKKILDFVRGWRPKKR